VLKWVGSLVSLLLIAAMAVNLRWGVGWYDWQRGSGWSVQQGALYLVFDAYQDVLSHTAPFQLHRGRPIKFVWVPGVSRGPGLVGTAVVIPLWLPLIPIAVPTAILTWHDRCIPPGHCQQCGYNLTGNVSGWYPECGQQI
jgi:hypothetical protein